MKHNPDITIEKKLAVIALILAALALIAGHPVNFIEYPDWELRDQAGQKNTFKILSAPALAEWIKVRRNDFIVIDIRQKEKYDKYHIPDAAFIDSTESIYPDGKTKMVFYDADGKSYSRIETYTNFEPGGEIYILDGGMEMWRKIVLFPDITHMIIEDKKRVDKIAATSRYFGGKPKLPQSVKSGSKAKYLREGC